LSSAFRGEEKIGIPLGPMGIPWEWKFLGQIHGNGKESTEIRSNRFLS